MEAAFATSAALRRPIPDLATLAPATPALRSIVTAPPVFGAAAQASGVSAV
jgi:hypothetical protein